jgi:hypothetical protein
MLYDISSSVPCKSMRFISLFRSSKSSIFICFGVTVYRAPPMKNDLLP